MDINEKKEYVKLFAESLGAQQDVVPPDVQDALLTVLLAESGPEYALGGAVGALMACGFECDDIVEFVRLTARKVESVKHTIDSRKC